MISSRQLIHTAFLFILPLIVAWFGLSIWAALLLVAAALLWRWLIVLSRFVIPEKHPAMVLETIAASHFAEKVRWSLDRLELDYTEVCSAGLLGVMFTGRTVPRLNVQTGLVRSSIGNSAEILRYLWGQYSAQLETADFLQPTPERLELEAKLDRLGRNLQQWIYYHVLSDRSLTLHLWGANHPAVPAWQRGLMRGLFPLTATYVRFALSVSRQSYDKACTRTEDLLAEVETKLADGRLSILGGDQLNYSDITFAAIMGLWLQPQNYGAGVADAALVGIDQLPPAMQSDIQQWSDDYPRATAFINHLYAKERLL